MKSSLVERAPVLQGLDPIGDVGSRVLILGSFPSEASLAAQEYYAHPQNKFWLIMGQLFGFTPSAAYEDRVAALMEHRVAVWDVIGRCRRAGSMDHAIQDAEANDILIWLAEHPAVRGIAFNGGKAEETALKSVPGLCASCDLVIRRMPSTSPANASIPIAAKIEAWSQIKEWAEKDAQTRA